MASRGQSITVTVTAWNTSTLQGQAGDAANITLQWIKDGTIAPTTNPPVEVSAGAAPGEYNITLTTGECTAFAGKVCGVSSTPNVVIVPVSVTFEDAVTLADGAITDAKITMPTETTGAPSTSLQILLWIAGMLGLRKVVKDANTGNITQYTADGVTVKTVSTYNSATGVDTLNKAT